MHLELGKTLNMEEVKATLKKHLADVFEVEWVEEG
jgi:hypothetical protein